VAASGLAACRSHIIAAWQESLGYIAPGLADDVVQDVIAARRTRVVLLTSSHIAYLIARQHHSHGSGHQVADVAAFMWNQWLVHADAEINLVALTCCTSHRLVAPSR
jgi:hypothetical protein